MIRFIIDIEQEGQGVAVTIKGRPVPEDSIPTWHESRYAEVFAHHLNQADEATGKELNAQKDSIVPFTLIQRQL